MKKVLVVGCGAIGSLFAAHLAKGGEVEVYAFDVSQPHVDAINRHGLRLSGAADLHVKLAKASTDPAELPVCDYGVVATKAIHTASAIKAAARCFDDNSAVCSVQNGVGNEELIAEHVKYVIRGTTFPAGHIVEPGHVGFDIKGDTWIGPFEPTNTPMERVEELAGYMTRGGMNTIALGRCARRAVDQADLQCGDESGGRADAAASRRGDALSADRRTVRGADPGRRGRGQGDGNRVARQSARSGRQGRERSRQAQSQHVAGCASASRITEVDFMNGAIVKWGEKYGVPTPLNRAMWALIKGWSMRGANRRSRQLSAVSRQLNMLAVNIFQSR